MGELIRLIDGVDIGGYKGLATGYIEANIDGGGEPKNYYEFVSIWSPFYPELGEYYEDKITDWLDKLVEEQE